MQHTKCRTCPTHSEIPLVLSRQAYPADGFVRQSIAKIVVVTIFCCVRTLGLHLRVADHRSWIRRPSSRYCSLGARRRFVLLGCMVEFKILPVVVVHQAGWLLLSTLSADKGWLQLTLLCSVPRGPAITHFGHAFPRSTSTWSVLTLTYSRYMRLLPESRPG